MDTPRLPSSARPSPNGAGHDHSLNHNHVQNNRSYSQSPNHDRTHPDNKVQRPVAVSLLQPRVAVLLGLPKHWYRTLSICRLLCIVPCFWWGLRITLRFLVAQVLRRLHGVENAEEPSLMLTETLLAGLWCLASGSLAFTFTDCLMSRWLINYTPQATVVRLLTISCVFAYLTSWVVYVTGGAKDPRLLLPAWIGIATILTGCYHYTQRKVPIRKETYASIRVFSVASFISTVALLLDINRSRPSPEAHVPLVTIAKAATHLTGRIVVKILGVSKDGTGR